MEIIPVPGFSEPLSSWSHLLAAVAALAGLFFFLHKARGNIARLASLLIFSFALIFLFSMSGVYHLLEPQLTPRLVFQRLDHAAIWILIAGTFTPVHMILFRGAWRWGVLLAVWSVAIIGLVLGVIFFDATPLWLSLCFYLGLGSVGVLTGSHFRQVYGHRSERYLWLGGLFYFIGAILDFLNWPNLLPGVVTAHEIFHLFVILGAASHWLFVYRWASYPTANNITFHVSVLPQNQYIAKAVGELIRLEAHSMEILREKIQEAIDKLFHKNMRPETIKIKYFNEELL